MAFLNKARKEDLRTLADELGEEISSQLKVSELRNIITSSEAYEEDFVKSLLETITSARLEQEKMKKEEEERQDRLKKEAEERQDRLKAEERQDRLKREERDFELKKMKLSTLNRAPSEAPICLPLAEVDLECPFGHTKTKAAVVETELDQGRYLLGNGTAVLLDEARKHKSSVPCLLNAVQTSAQKSREEDTVEPSINSIANEMVEETPKLVETESEPEQQEELARLQVELEKVYEKLDKSQCELRLAQTEKDRMQLEKKNVQSELELKMKQLLSKSEAKVQRTVSENSRLQFEVKCLKQELQDSTDYITKYRESHERLQAEYDRSQKDGMKLQEKLEAGQKEVRKAHEDGDTLVTKQEDFETELEHSLDALATIYKQLEVRKDDLTNASEQNKQLKAEQSKSQKPSVKATASEDIQRLKKQLDWKQRALVDQQKKIKDAQEMWEKKLNKSTIAYCILVTVSGKEHRIIIIVGYSEFGNIKFLLCNFYVCSSVEEICITVYVNTICV